MVDSDTFDAATVAVMRQALGNEPFDAAGPLTTVEAGQRLRRLDALAKARAAGMDIRVVTLEEAAQMLWEGDGIMGDVADYVDMVEAHREAVAEEPPPEPWDPMHPPTNGRALTARGVAPEAVASVLYPIQDVQDDGLPWAVPWNEAPEVADDGGAVVEWRGMYDE